MKKISMAAMMAAFLVMSFCPAVFALGAADLPALRDGAPVAVTCTGSSVKLRAEPGQSAATVTLLAKNETVFAVGQKSLGEPYPWVQVTTERGFRGWMYGQYVSFTEKDTAPLGRFKALFESSVLFDDIAWQRVLGQQGKKRAMTEEEKNVTGYGLYTLVFDNGLAIVCEADSFNSASLKTPGTSVAGLKVGDKESVLTAFSKNMNSIGWQGGYKNGEGQWISYMKDAFIMKEYGEPRSGRSFGVRCSKGRIKELWWCIHLID